MQRSRSSRARGLKPSGLRKAGLPTYVALFTGAWIEAPPEYISGEADIIDKMTLTRHCTGSAEEY